MDKSTLSQYGWVIICIIVIAILLGLATPFGNFVKDSVYNTTTSFGQKISNSLDFDSSGGSGDSDDKNQVDEEPTYMLVIDEERSKEEPMGYYVNNSDLDEIAMVDLDAVITYEDNSTKNIVLSLIENDGDSVIWAYFEEEVIMFGYNIKMNTGEENALSNVNIITIQSSANAAKKATSIEFLGASVNLSDPPDYVSVYLYSPQSHTYDDLGNNLAERTAVHLYQVKENVIKCTLTYADGSTIDTSTPYSAVGMSTTYINNGSVLKYVTVQEIINGETITTKFKVVTEDEYAIAETYSYAIGKTHYNGVVVKFNNDCSEAIITKGIASGDGLMYDLTENANCDGCGNEHEKSPMFIHKPTSVIIEEGVVSIGDAAFEYCEKLVTITIPDTITSIGKGAFRDCTSLTEITIPNSVTSIGKYAFRNIASGSTIYCESQDVANLLINGTHYYASETTVIVDVSKF